MFGNFKLWIALGLLQSIYGSALNGQNPKISTDLTKVKFYLWTPESGPNNPFEFSTDVDVQELVRHGFVASRNTKIISHGWNSAAIDFCQEFVEAYFSHSDRKYNIIGIEWSPLATWDNYITAANNAVRVGRHSGEHLAKILIRQLGQSPLQIHAIGHSLGGHLVGLLGRTIQSFGGKGKIARVTALDPAAPWFEVMEQEKRVLKSDANLVDVIHTNSGSIVQLCLSLKESLGHIDFYPNGGSHQAGCNDVCMASVCTESNLIDLLNGACSHGRVKYLYIESILNSPYHPTFLSKSCDSWENFLIGDCHESIEEVQMGEALDPTKIPASIFIDNIEVDNKFYLFTNEEPPYSL